MGILCAGGVVGKRWRSGTPDPVRGAGRLGGASDLGGGLRAEDLGAWGGCVLARVDTLRH